MINYLRTGHSFTYEKFYSNVASVVYDFYPELKTVNPITSSFRYRSIFSLGKREYNKLYFESPKFDACGNVVIPCGVTLATSACVVSNYKDPGKPTRRIIVKGFSDDGVILQKPGTDQVKIVPIPLEPSTVI